MFYTFHQNNSGGSFVRNESVRECVIIEADTFEDALDRALEWTDIYFDGVYKDIDCDCCGDRWSHPDDGTGIPVVYDLFVVGCNNERSNTIIYYKDGSRQYCKWL